MINLARLKSQLNTSGIQNTNPALYQVIIQLIEFVQKLFLELEDDITTTSGGSVAGLAALAALITLIKNSDLLTHSDESTNFPNSRELLAGTGVTFDDSVPNARSVSVVPAIDRQWSVLTDGDVLETELIFAGGEVVMISIP